MCPILETHNHKLLKEFVGKREIEMGNQIMLESKLLGKTIDVITFNGNKVVKLTECLVSENLSHAMRKLNQIPLSIKKEIIRFKREKNPKARKIIQEIVSYGIIFTEIEEPLLSSIRLSL